MRQAVVSFVALVHLAAGSGWAQSFSFTPQNPRPGDLVELTVITPVCGRGLRADVTPPGSANGTIRLTLDADCTCIATPLPFRGQQKVGPLPFGTYDIQVYLQYLEGAEPCGPPELFTTSRLTVGKSGPTLALHQGRFNVTADWNAPGFGQGRAQGVELTDESGYFTFASAGNVELVLKVLNGCPLNQRFWVFLAGLTDIGVTVQVEDTTTGQRKTYTHPPGRAFQPVLDTDALATCP